MTAAQGQQPATADNGRRARVRSHLGSLAKAVSWRVTAGIDTFVISYLVTGSAKGAGSIAALELMTKIALFWAHERAWLRLARGDASRILPWRRGKAAPNSAETDHA